MVTVAIGAVKSIIPSAFDNSGAASPISLTSFSSIPASFPESQPISGERTSSRAPTSENSLLSAIALTTVRPIRPPAPPTTRRISPTRLAPILGQGESGAEQFVWLAAQREVAKLSEPGGWLRYIHCTRPLIPAPAELG